MFTREEQQPAAPADNGSKVTPSFRHRERNEPAMGEAVFNALYDELRGLAGGYLDRETRGIALQPTVLVQEAYRRLANERALFFESRIRFFGFAGHLMRRILVSRVRFRNTVKGENGTVAVSLETLDLLADGKGGDRANLIDLDDALRLLELIDGRRASIVELRFFAGLNENEIAEFLRLSPSTVRREWATAKLWLSRELAPAPTSECPGPEEGTATKPAGRHPFSV